MLSKKPQIRVVCSNLVGINTNIILKLNFFKKIVTFEKQELKTENSQIDENYFYRMPYLLTIQPAC